MLLRAPRAFLAPIPPQVSFKYGLSLASLLHAYAQFQQVEGRGARFELRCIQITKLVVDLWCAVGKRVTTPADDKSFVQQAKEGIAAAAAVTADKASQAYQ